VVRAPDPGSLPPSRVPLLGRDPVEHWAKHDPTYWAEGYEDFLWFFFGQCFPEPHSSRQVEQAVEWGLETTPDVLVAQHRSTAPSRGAVERWCAEVTQPVLVLHGDRDLISPLSCGERIAELTGGELVTLEGCGHIPLARDPVRVNHLLRAFADRFRPPRPRRWVRAARRRRRVLYLSSPIGLGHARRDLAVVQALRRRHGGLEVDWLAQHPVTRLLEAAGERVHPASRWLASESRHVEDESGEHDLHCFDALRRMDEVLVGNFMVFDDVVRDEHYDLVVGDEAWEVDHFLHENPGLKRFGYVWLTDFVGLLPMPDDDERLRRITADHNAEMIEHVERYPRLRDRAILRGQPRRRRARTVRTRPAGDRGVDATALRVQWLRHRQRPAPGRRPRPDPRRPRVGTRRAGVRRDRRRLRGRRSPAPPGRGVLRHRTCRRARAAARGRHRTAHRCVRRTAPAGGRGARVRPRPPAAAGRL